MCSWAGAFVTNLCKVTPPLPPPSPKNKKTKEGKKLAVFSRQDSDKSKYVTFYNNNEGLLYTCNHTKGEFIRVYKSRCRKYKLQKYSVS